MRFSNQSVEIATQQMAAQLQASLAQGKRVLWLVSGGSCVLPQVNTMRLLVQSASVNHGSLAILPVDERYGPRGHADSNAEQLRAAGFDADSAVWHDILISNRAFGPTVEHYTEIVNAAFAAADIVFATLGIGADGHTAGILPHSPAVSDSALVVGYHWSDYERMTLGAALLRGVDCAWVLAYGEAKQPALRRLQEGAEPFASLPAILLRDIPDVTVYNDSINTEE